MLRIHFLYPAIAITVIWLILKAVTTTFTKNKFEIKREVVNLLYYISVMGLIGLTLFPLEIVTSSEKFPELDLPSNFIPFASIYDLLNSHYYMVPLKNILGNIVLFVPFGFISVLKFKRINNLRSVFLVGLLTSLTIELIQLTLPNRAFDIDDIILNALGTMIGYLICKVIRIEQLFGLSSIPKQIN